MGKIFRQPLPTTGALITIKVVGKRYDMVLPYMV